MKQSPLSLGILIRNTNSRDLILELLRQIDEPWPFFVETFLLDNGSNEQESLEKDISRFQIPIQYSRVSEPLSYATSFNKLFRQALIAECDYILILENTQDISQGELKQLIKTANSSSASLFVFGNMPLHFVFELFLTSFVKSNRLFCWIGSRYLFHTINQQSLLVKTTHLRHINNLFEPRLYRSFELLDLILLVSSLQLVSVMSQPFFSSVIHKPKELDPYFQMRNDYLIIEKWIASPTRFIAAGMILSIQIVHMIYTLVFVSRSTNILIFKLKGIKDGWRIFF